MDNKKTLEKRQAAYNPTSDFACPTGDFTCPYYTGVYGTCSLSDPIKECDEAYYADQFWHEERA